MTYALTNLAANGFPNELFIAFLFNDHDVGVQFSKYVGLIPSNVVCFMCGSQMSWCVDASVINCYR
jgi:hypothetical protein